MEGGFSPALQSHVEILSSGSPFVGWPSCSTLSLGWLVHWQHLQTLRTERAGGIRAVRKVSVSSLASGDLSNFRPVCVLSQNFFSFWFVAKEEVGTKKTEISVRCDLAAVSSGLLIARAWPALTEVPGMMLALVPWPSEDENSLTSVARRGRVEVASEVVKHKRRNRKQWSSAGPESVQVETLSKCWKQNGLNDVPNRRLLHVPPRSFSHRSNRSRQ